MLLAITYYAGKTETVVHLPRGPDWRGCKPVWGTAPLHERRAPGLSSTIRWMQPCNIPGPRRARHNIQRELVAYIKINKQRSQDYLQAFRSPPYCYFYCLMTSLSAYYVQNIVICTTRKKEVVVVLIWIKNKRVSQKFFPFPVNPT